MHSDVKRKYGNLRILIRQLFLVTVPVLVLNSVIGSIAIPSSEACVSTAVTPKTAVTTSTSSPTTTTVTQCPSSAPLFTNEVENPGPGHTKVTFLPSLTSTVSSPFGASIAVDCIGDDPSVTDTSYRVQFDDSTMSTSQDIDNIPSPSGTFERIMLTCTPSAKWQVELITSSGPESNIVSSPGAIICEDNS